MVQFFPFLNGISQMVIAFKSILHLEIKLFDFMIVAIWFNFLKFLIHFKIEFQMIDLLLKTPHLNSWKST